MTAEVMWVALLCKLLPLCIDDDDDDCNDYDVVCKSSSGDGRVLFATITTIFFWSPWKLYPLEHLVAVVTSASASYSIMNIHSMQITTSTGFKNLLNKALN